MVAWKLYREAKTISFQQKANYCWQMHEGEITAENHSRLKLVMICIRSIEEEIATLAMANKDVTPLRNQYKNFLHTASELALQSSDYYAYHLVKFKLDSLKRQ